MPINDRDDVNHREFARVIGIGAWACLRRGGHLTASEERRIERIVERASIREDEKREIRRAAREARDKAKRQEAVERAAKRRGWL